ncbi:MAG: uncharacterized protein JWO12_298 [Frankiales bacterium]|nr:uncharacterized protein [Frankiales bacterium]
MGQLIGELASDLSTLLRQEIELAKTELKVEVSKAGKGAGLVGGAGYAGLMVGVFASLTLMFVLDLGMPTWVAALLVTIAWAIAGYVLFTRGRQQMKSVHPTPTQTVESIKETF